MEHLPSPPPPSEPYESYLHRVGRSTRPNSDPRPESAPVVAVEPSSSGLHTTTGAVFRPYSPLPRPFPKYNGPPEEGKEQRTSSAPPGARKPLPRHRSSVVLALAWAGSGAYGRHEHHFAFVSPPSETCRLYHEPRQHGGQAVHCAGVL